MAFNKKKMFIEQIKNDLKKMRKNDVFLEKLKTAEYLMPLEELKKNGFIDFVLTSPKEVKITVLKLKEEQKTVRKLEILHFVKGKIINTSSPDENNKKDKRGNHHFYEMRTIENKYFYFPEHLLKGLATSRPMKIDFNVRGGKVTKVYSAENI